MTALATKRKFICALIIITLAFAMIVPAYAFQEYTYAYSGSIEAIGSLYVYQIDDYVRIGMATTYVSGGTGIASTYAYLYTNHSAYGPYEASATGSMSNGVLASTKNKVFPEGIVTSVSCSHHVVLPNGDVLTPAGQSYIA